MNPGYRANLTLGLFRGNGDEGVSAIAMRALLDCLLAIDCAEIVANPGLPEVYASGVKYRVRHSQCGEDMWRDILACVEEGIADCKDLACWRAADLIVRHGIRAYPIFIRQERPDGGQLFHILVWREDQPDHPEDPSLKLGMTASG